MRPRVPLIAASLALVLATFPARGAVEWIVAGQSSQTFGSYATPVVVAHIGDPLTFLNLDSSSHNVTSDATGPTTQPWCKFFDEGECPLLWSPVTDAGGRQSLVRGLENAVSGTAYPVHCVIHPVIRGTVIAV